ncbi:MAG: hypothetical protein HY789_10500 [Deltaproteobacteria bacterium]|nr:hypothetical protein [Deltaproteobacteria bacterium]
MEQVIWCRILFLVFIRFLHSGHFLVNGLGHFAQQQIFEKIETTFVSSFVPAPTSDGEVNYFMNAYTIGWGFASGKKGNTGKTGEKREEEIAGRRHPVWRGM